MRIAILVSGRGSNMKSLAATIGTLPHAELVLVGSDKECAGITWAQNQGYDTWQADCVYVEAELNAALKEQNIDLICLAGFMRLLSKDFVADWQNKIVNIHPSLLPAFPGLDTHARALARGVKYHGCTVHYVDAGMDTGPIIDQQTVLVLKADTEESLSARVLEAEHELYSRALVKICAAT